MVHGFVFEDLMGMTDAQTGHFSVMKAEVLSLCASTSRIAFLDCTYGGGGHTEALLNEFPESRVEALDCDPQAVERSRLTKEKFEERFAFHDINFSELDTLPLGSFSAILIDAGVSSFQLDEGDRGFSFRAQAPADMRLNPREGMSAADFLETAERYEVVHAIKVLGEEKFWQPVVKAIMAARGSGRLQNTVDLAHLIEESLPKKAYLKEKIHPATRSFQGIRIAVNRELEVLEEALQKALHKLEEGGLLIVISFHSLEDRIVKKFMRKMAGKSVGRNDSTPDQLRPRWGELVMNRPWVASDEELALNRRSRSAKLRAFKKLSPPLAA